MLSLLQSRRVRGEAGEPLPSVFRAFDDLGIVFRRGQYVLIAAGSGTGKSILALTIALRSKVPTLYFSGDSDAFTQLSRSIAILDGCTMEQAFQAVLQDDLDHVSEKLGGIPTRLNYSSSPNMETIENSMEAYEEVYGEYPALVIVDNITNVDTGAEDEQNNSGNLESLNDYLHDMARNTSACVVGLHHVVGEYGDGNKPIPKSGIKNKIDRVPEMILTGWSPGPDMVGWSLVKNRGYKDDKSGHTYAELSFDGSRAKLSDPVTSGVQGLTWNEPVDADLTPVDDPWA